MSVDTAGGRNKFVPTISTDSQWLPWAIRLTSLVLFLTVWEWYGRQGDVFAISPPSKVFASLWEGLVSGDMVTAAVGTLATFVVAYAISAVGGVLIGIAIAVSRWAENTLEPLVYAGYATPMSLLIPVIGIYTGLGFRGRVTLAVIWSIFEVIVTTASGVRAVPPTLVEAGKAFNASKMDLYRKIIFPAALPTIALGLRLGVGRALRGAVTAEVLLSVTNLGGVMVLAGVSFDIPRLLAGIFLVMALGFIMMRVAETAERKIVRTRQGQV